MPSRAEMLADIKRLGDPDAQAQSQRQQMLGELQSRELNKLEALEAPLVLQAQIEKKLGGELVYGNEIPDFWLQRGIYIREELPRAVAYADQSGELPEGARAYGIQTDAGENFVAYKFDGDKKFYAINDPGPSKGDIGKYGGSLITGETLGAAAAELLMPWKKVVGPAKTLYRLGQMAMRTMKISGAAAAGRGADETIEAIDDGDFQTMQSIKNKMLESAAWTAAGHVLLSEPFEVIAGKLAKHGISPKDLLRAEEASPEELSAMADLLDLKDDELKALVKAIAEEDLPPLGMGDVGNPIFKRAQSQAAGVSGESLAREEAKQSAPARRMLESRYGVGDVKDLDDAALEEVVEKQEKDAQELMKRAFSERGIDFSDTRPEVAGKLAAETVLDYRKTTSEQASRNFDAVFELADAQGIEFDISDVVAAARKEVASRSLAGRQGVEDVDIPAPVEGQLRTILSRLTEANDIQGPDKLAALRQIRTDLREAAEPGNRVTSTPSEAAASRVLGALTDSINGTKNTGDDAYRAAVTKANEHWRGRQANLDAFSYMAATNTTGAGERIYRRVFSGDLTEEEAKFLVTHMKGPRLNEFRSALYTDMMRNPDKINSTLRQMDRAGEHLVPKNAREVLNVYRREIERSNKSLVKNLLEAQAKHGERVSTLIEKGDSKDLRLLVDNGALSEADISRAIVADFIQHTTDFKKGQPVTNLAKYETKIKQYQDKGVLDLLEPTAKNMLTNIRVYNSFLPRGADAGDSIASAAIASDVLKAAQSPVGAVRAGFRIYQLQVASRLAHSPALLRVLKGKPEMRTFPVARAFVAAGTIELQKMNRRKEE